MADRRQQQAEVRPGDRLIVRRRHQGAVERFERCGVVLQVLSVQEPRYRVRWDQTGLEGVVYPRRDQAVEYVPAQRRDRPPGGDRRPH